MSKCRTFYIADLHLGDPVVAEFRGFSSAEEMDRAILRSFRKTLRPGDTCYLVGDLFTDRADGTVLEELGSLARLILVKGNCEDRWLPQADLTLLSRVFEDICTEAACTDGDSLVGMSHLPRPELMPEKGYLLFGHLFTTHPRRADWAALCQLGSALNVRADLACRVTEQYAPATLEEWKFFNAVWRSDPE